MIFGHYLHLAVHSVSRNPVLTGLMVLTIGFGVAASVTTWTVFRAASGDPIPAKSSQLFVPQIDNWGPKYGGEGSDPPDALTYMDAIALMRARRAKYQSAMYLVTGTVTPQYGDHHPVFTAGEAVSSGFFPMLDVPFLYGGAWTRAREADRAHVVVISSWLNDRIFGGDDSVGKMLTIGAHTYRVVGVLAHWHPEPVFYDVVNNAGGFNAIGGRFFIPFTTAISLGVRNGGHTRCNSPPAQPGFVGLQHSECIWVAFMVQLSDTSAVRKYREFLIHYAARQRAAGRFHWPPNVRLWGLMAWLGHRHVVPPNVRISFYLALGLLLVCLVNTAGLLLAKFLKRSGEICIRRALGASRREIYMQFLIEAGMVGLAGGILGLVLTALGVASAGWVLPPTIAALAQVDVPLLLTTLGVAIVATVLAGLYPTVRAAAVQPAWQLKVN